MLTTGTYRGYGGRRAGLEFEDSASALTLSSVWLTPPTLDSSYLSCTRTHCTIVPGFSSALTGSGHSTYVDHCSADSQSDFWIQFGSVSSV